MQTLGDIVQIGLIVLGVYAAARVLWRAWIRPLFASDTHPESIHRQESLPHVRWSLRGELTRLFLVQGETVNTSQVVMSSDDDPSEADDQTDEDRPALSIADEWLDRLEVDRTRATVVDLLVYSGWTVSDIRKANLLRGDNALIGPEVEAARARLGLGITAEPRVLQVRDEKGQRVIPFDSKQIA